ALAEYFDLEPRCGGDERRRDVAERERLADTMAVTARGDPADHLAVVPHGFVADRVRLVRRDDERHHSACGTLRSVAQYRFPADEIRLRDIDKPVEAGLRRRVDRPIFACPVAEALFEAQRMERTRAEMAQSETRAGRDDRIVERELAIRRHPDFVAQLAGERDATDVRRQQ